MQSAPAESDSSLQRSPVFWVVFGALIVAQLVAVWMLCARQVRVADDKRSEMQAQQLAVADCLRHVPNATLTSCGRRVGREVPQPPNNLAEVQVSGKLQGTGPIPVSFQRKALSAQR